MGSRDQEPVRRGRRRGSRPTPSWRYNPDTVTRAYDMRPIEWLPAEVPGAILGFLLLSPGSAMAQAAPPIQRSADDYTRYELLAPGTAKFRILYDVTATASGARLFFNPIRKGSEASDESVLDPVTGTPLRFTVVDGATARAGGLPTADLETQYLRVELPRPVPTGGEVRIRIDKTYRDPKSYLVSGDTVVFTRSLSIKKNAVVLPKGYELIEVNYPSQVLTEADGRIAVSFINLGPDPVSLVVRGRRLP